MNELNIFVAFAAGILSFLSPCVLPLIPSYLSFVSGVSLDEMHSNQARARWRLVLNSVAFITGFSLVFVSLGASASLLGSFFFKLSKFDSPSGGRLHRPGWDLSHRSLQNPGARTLSPIQS